MDNMNNYPTWLRNLFESDNNFTDVGENDPMLAGKAPADNEAQDKGISQETDAYENDPSKGDGADSYMKSDDNASTDTSIEQEAFNFDDDDILDLM